MRTFMRIWMVLGLAALLGACSEATKPEDVINELIESGWALYERGEFQAAFNNFSLAVENGGGADAQLGKGWSGGAVGQYQAAKTAFDNAGTGPEVVAGRAAVLLVLEQYGDCIIDVNDALSQDPSFVFSHNADFNVDDLKHVKASAQWGNGDLLGAAATVNDLSSDLAAGVDINPSYYPSWLVDGTQYPTFEKALLAALIYLGELTGA
jgi:tetratricopeptide (TPR) repeat protein